MPDMDRIKEKAVDASLMGLGAMLPVYSKVARAVSSAASSTPAKAVTGVVKVGAAFAEPIVRTFVDSLTGSEEAPTHPEPGRSGEPVPGARSSGSETSLRTRSAAPTDSAGTPAEARQKSAPKAPAKTSAKKTAAKKPSAKKTSAKRSTAKKSTGKKTTGSSAGRSTSASSAVAAAAPQPIDLPLPTYPSLSLTAALDALNGLTVDQLGQVREYEVAHENRLPILDRIDQLVDSVS